jgi:endonuclease YncB( thermonuclease family)
VKRFLIAALIALLACPAAFADDFAARRSNESRKKELPTEPFTGKAWAVDGDTLNVTVKGAGDVRVRLWGVDAPEMKNWPFGQRSRAGLDYFLFLGNNQVTCEPKGKSHNRVVARCVTSAPSVRELTTPGAMAARDLGEDMIAWGLAVEYRSFTGGRYRKSECLAIKTKRGIWAAGVFTGTAAPYECED